MELERRLAKFHLVLRYDTDKYFNGDDWIEVTDAKTESLCQRFDNFGEVVDWVEELEKMFEGARA